MPTLDYLIEHSQLSLEAIAMQSGLDVERVRVIVEGRWTPSADERAAIARVFNLPVDQIAFGHNMNARNIRFRRFNLDKFDSEPDA